jgi:hypothetical protein
MRPWRRRPGAPARCCAARSQVTRQPGGRRGTGLTHVRGSTTPAFVPYAARYNGKRWTTVKVPATGQITAFSAISPSHIWAVTGTSGMGDELPLR